MVRNDVFFLSKWISYYGGELGTENLFVFIDGEDQPIPEGLPREHVTVFKKDPKEVTVADRERIALISAKAAELLKTYDLVIGCDADECLVVDPACGMPLAEYLSSIKVSPSVSGLGMDVGQRIGEEGPIDASKPFLSQRKYALLDSQYTKPVCISKPLRWGAGFHRTKNHNYRIDKNLYLFHFGSVDEAIYLSKFNDPERIEAGWTKHMVQRRRTIDLLNKKKIHEGDFYLRLARFLQTLIRHPFAWLRPYMYYWKLIVRIPERFSRSV